MKRRVNLTVDGELYAAALGVAKIRKRSLSEMVEYPLRRIVEHITIHGEAADLTPEEHWLDRFHRKHLPARDVALPEKKGAARKTGDE